MLKKTTLKFLSNLKSNNNRDWFLDNRSSYEDAKADFTNYIDSLVVGIKKFDKSIAHQEAKNCVFRINRDIRFSKDKSPYKLYFGAHITSASKKTELHSRAGYYIHIEPGKSMLAGGAYCPPGPWLKAIRSEIDHNSTEFKKILSGKDFKNYFGEIEGEKLVSAPKEYFKENPNIELLKYKSYLAVHKLPDELLLSKTFTNHSIEVFKVLKPFSDFLNRSLD